MIYKSSLQLIKFGFTKTGRKRTCTRQAFNECFAVTPVWVISNSVYDIHACFRFMCVPMIHACLWNMDFNGHIRSPWAFSCNWKSVCFVQWSALPALSRKAVGYHDNWKSAIVTVAYAALSKDSIRNKNNLNMAPKWSSYGQVWEKLHSGLNLTSIYIYICVFYFQYKRSRRYFQ